MSKSTPPPPDYNALALQQGAMNAEAARQASLMNNPNETGPYGSRTWSATPDAAGRYSVDTSLNEGEQTKYDLQTQLMNALMAAGGTYGMPALTKALQTDYTPPREAQLGWENDYAPDQRLQTESGMYEAPWIQEGLDFSGAAPIPTGDAATRQRVEDSIYQMGARTLDPQWAGNQAALDSKLSNQGIFTGSAAHAGAQQELDNAKTAAYGDLRDRSIQGGGQEMSNLFGMGLQQHNTGVADITNQGTFANSARGQLISELLGDMSARNQAITGQANIATGQQGASNTGTQAWLTQKAQASTLPINVVTALMSGGQVNTPNFQPYNNNITWDPAPVYQAGKDTYQANLNSVNAKNAGTGQLLQTGAMVGAAFL